MSKDIIVLTPNGRRQKIQCTPDTSMLQVLEDVCKKQGFKSSEYDLKYHNHIIDLTTTIRFSNVPNKATLEMVEIERKREELNVTIGLMLEDGERRMADFSPNTTLFDMATSLAPQEINLLQHPTILYMRQEVTGLSALKERTLRQLGLIKGRAILRLLNKAEEAKQANVSTVYRRPVNEMSTRKEVLSKDNYDSTKTDDISDPGPSNLIKDKSHDFNPLNLIKQEKLLKENTKKDTHQIEEEDVDMVSEEMVSEPAHEEHQLENKNSSSSNSSMSQDNLERRLKIEEEVSFIGSQKAIAFMQPDVVEDELEDLPDDFYDLTIAEVRKLYNDLQQHRLELENTPLLTSAKREQITQQSSEHKLNTYKNVVVRIQFPDHMILQGVFCPSNTIEDVMNFVKEHLAEPNRPFLIFTTPLKETLDPKMTLQDAKFVPCVHMHFKWLEENTHRNIYLKEEIYSKKTSSDAASILASKYRAPSRRKIQDASHTSQTTSGETASTSKNSKVPKWFKN